MCERSSQAQRRMSALANFMEVGVLLLRADGKLEFANATARELLGCERPGDLEQRWDSMKHMLEVAFDHSGPLASAGTRADVDVPVSGRARRLRVELHRPDEDERSGYLVLLKDRA